MTAHYKLYAAGPSFFSAKLRAYLDYKAFTYEQVTASAHIYKTVIKPKTGLNVIPVLECPDGKFLQDTQEIIHNLEAKHSNPPVKSSQSSMEFLGAFFELLLDEWFVLYAMHYRWSYAENYSQLYRDFGALAFPKFPGFLQRFIGKKVGLRFSAFCPALGIHEETREFIERQFKSHLQILNDHFQSHPFLLGTQVCVGDFSLAGACNGHLLHDVYPKRLLQESAPQLTQAIQSLAAANNEALTNISEIPASTFAFLSQLCQEYFPVLKETVNSYQDWAQEQQSDAAMPRAFGNIQVTMHDDTVMKRKAMSFHMWKLQGVLAHYQALSDKEKTAFSDRLPDYNIEAFTEALERYPVVRKNNRLFLGAG